MKLFASLAVATAIFAGPAYAKCSNSGAGFDQFKKEFASYAKRNGIGKRGLRELAKTKYSSKVIAYDQKIWRKAKATKGGNGSFNFDKFYNKKTAYTRQKGPSILRKHRRTFDKVERRYGVPREVLTVIWGMETNFGGYMGKSDVITSLAALSHNCRRSSLFRPHLLGALKIVDKGWMKRSQMKGAMHGEIGMTQFLAGNYAKYGVDFDRNGRVDLRRSVPDVLASTANFLRSNGWRPGQSYQPGSHNFRVLNAWNEWTAYQQTIARAAKALERG